MSCNVETVFDVLFDIRDARLGWEHGVVSLRNIAHRRIGANWIDGHLLPESE